MNTKFQLKSVKNYQSDIAYSNVCHENNRIEKIIFEESNVFGHELRTKC